MRPGSGCLLRGVRPRRRHPVASVWGLRRGGGRLTLIRRPGRHADRPPEGAHTAYFAWSGTDPWLLVTRVEAAEGLLEADLDALARGDRRAVRASLPGAAPSEPILLVCTNGRRDVCCAVRGRPVAVDAARVAP